MLVALGRRLPPAFVSTFQGFPVAASGLHAEVGAIACDAVRLGALAPSRAFSSAAGRVSSAARADLRALLAPFRRPPRVSASSAARERAFEGFAEARTDARVSKRTKHRASRTRGAARASAAKTNDDMGKLENSGVARPGLGGVKEKEKGFQKKGVGSRAYLQVLALGTDVNDTSPSVLLFTDTQRIAFNVGEGFQRFAVEHAVNLRRLNRVVFTRVNARTTGGLTGMLLTMADGATEHHEDEPELQVHGPPRVERLMSAVETLVGGRGVRTVVHAFPIADAGGGIPTVDDDCVTLTPVVVRPRFSPRAPASGSGFEKALLGDARRRKRPKTADDDASDRSISNPGFTNFLSVDPDRAESVIYHGRMAGMPGKFDSEKADRLGVPRGVVRGKLVRGEDARLDDGSVIRCSDVVAPSRPGFRFMVVDVPTLEHLDEIADWNSSCRARLRATAARDSDSELVVVVHLAPSFVATSEKYARWMRECEAFSNRDGSRKPHHLMVHSTATNRAPVFGSARSARAKLSAVDAEIFPEPIEFAARGEADEPDEPEAADATEWSATVVRGENLTRFALVPLDSVGLDPPPTPRPAARGPARTGGSAREAAGTTEQKNGAPLRDSRETRDETETETVPSAFAGFKRGDFELAFLGTGSSAPAKYRNVSGIFFDSRRFGTAFLDCGEGSFGQMLRIYGERDARDRLRRLRLVWISHIHADHHAGLPSILVERRRAFEEAGELDAEPLLVIGPAPLRRFLSAFSQVEPLAYAFVDCRTTTEAQWAAAEKEAEEEKEEEKAEKVSAKQKNVGVFSLDPRTRLAVASLGLRRLVSVPVVHCAQSFGAVLESSASPGAPEGWKVAYSGDTRPCADLAAAARGCLVLIHEATFEDALRDEAVKKKHSTTGEAIRCGYDANAYRTILTHFSQRYPKAPLFDGGESNLFAGAGADADADADAKKVREYSNGSVGVAFDLMRVDFTALPRLPSLMPAIRAVFPDPVEDAEASLEGTSD